MTGSKDSRGYFHRLYSWIEDGETGKVGLHLNQRGVISVAKDRPEEISDSIWQYSGSEVTTKSMQ
jgi:hypothetical protein